MCQNTKKDKYLHFIPHSLLHPAITIVLSTSQWVNSKKQPPAATLHKKRNFSAASASTLPLILNVRARPSTVNSWSSSVSHYPQNSMSPEPFSLARYHKHCEGTTHQHLSRAIPPQGKPRQYKMRSALQSAPRTWDPRQAPRPMSGSLNPSPSPSSCKTSQIVSLPITGLLQGANRANREPRKAFVPHCVCRLFMARGQPHKRKCIGQLGFQTHQNWDSLRLGFSHGPSWSYLS